MLCADEAIIMLQRSYVVYPKEGPRPPTSDEFFEIARKNKERSTQALAVADQQQQEQQPQP